MKCKRQRLVRLKNSGYYTLIGCGTCPICLMHKQQEVALRLGYDIHSPRCFQSWFITLTYDDEHLEYDVVDENTGEIYPLPSVNKRTLQNFWKLLRYNLNYDSKKTELLYYATGEYGDTTKRPHYHAITYFLGENTLKKDFITACKMTWTNCDWSKIPENKSFQSTDSQASRLYVAKHQVKRCKGILGQAPYFALMSKGYGSEFFTYYPTEVQFLKDNGYLYLENKYKVPAPRYYLDKLDIHKTELEVIQIDQENRTINQHKIDIWIKDYRIRNPDVTYDQAFREWKKQNTKKIHYEDVYFDLMYKKKSQSNKI